MPWGKLMIDELDNADRPPPLPGDPRVFWSVGADVDEMALPHRREAGSTLERLVPSPFPRSGFPLIGFLATVYDHVAGFARERKVENNGATEPRPQGNETEPRP